MMSSNKLVYNLELTVGFASNLKICSDCKEDKFKPLELYHRYRKVKFVNVSMSALDNLGTPCDSFLEMLSDFNQDERMQCQMIRRIVVRPPYFLVFC